MDFTAEERRSLRDVAWSPIIWGFYESVEKVCNCVPLVRLLSEIRCGLPEDHLDYAAGRGNLEVIKLLVEAVSQWGENGLMNAAAGGHFEVVKWLWYNGCPRYFDPLGESIVSGHLDIVMWFVDEAEELIYGKHIKLAIKHERHDILKFLCDQPKSKRYEYHYFTDWDGD